MAALFCDAVFSSLSEGSRNVCMSILQFLRLVVNNEKKSKMGAKNVAIIFGTIVFEAPQTLDYTLFMEENALQARVFELMLTCYILYPNSFGGIDNTTISHYYAKSTTKVVDCYFLRGEELIVFYNDEDEDHIFGLFQKNIVMVTAEELEKSFTDTKIEHASAIRMAGDPDLSGPAMRASKKKSFRKRISTRKSVSISHARAASKPSDKAEMMEMLDKLRKQA